MLNDEQILDIFKKTNVLQEGHFALTSGKHSRQYMQCAQVLQYPVEAGMLCGQFVEKVKAGGSKVDLVVGPATGGIILAFETARQFGCKAIFTERENGKMVFRRGFKVEAGQKVFVVEDVITTGGSVREVVDIVRKQGGEVIGVGVLVNRSTVEVDYGAPLISLLKIDIQTWQPDECPLCQAAKPMTKPGSRNLT